MLLFLVVTVLSATAIARPAGTSASDVISARWGVAVLSDMDLGSEADSATRLMPNILVVLAEPTVDPGVPVALRRSQHRDVPARSRLSLVAATFGAEPEKPFFGSVLLLENHAPHACGAVDASNFPVRFADTEDSIPNSALREYLPRLGFTTTAVPSAAVLPTLLSGFVATSANDVYLGTNLGRHARCGSDAVQVDYGNFMEWLNSRNVDSRTADRRKAYGRALSGFRNSGVVRLQVSVAFT